MFASSTDYEEATDSMSHQIFGMISDAIMQKCGIPTLLRKIVLGVCSKERWVEFHSSGVLDEIGEPHPELPGVRRVRLKKGILMGDPMTKPCLHFLNICVREVP